MSTDTPATRPFHDCADVWRASDGFAPISRLSLIEHPGFRAAITAAFEAGRAVEVDERRQDAMSRG